MDVVLKAEVESGWKVYSLTQGGGGPVPLSVTAVPEIELEGPVQGPPPDRSLDPNFNIETETYAGAPEFRFAVKLAAAAVAPYRPAAEPRRSASKTRRNRPGVTHEYSLLS